MQVVKQVHMRTAYLLALVTDGKIVEFGIFSEPRPETRGEGIWLLVEESAAPEYSEAAAGLAAQARRGSFIGMGERCSTALRSLGKSGSRTRVEV